MELYHHGVKGQKWGVRRYQNPDGSLTNAGLKRYKRVVGNNKDLYVLERRKGQFDLIDNKTAKKVGDAIIDYEKTNAHLDWIGIKPKHRRKGYGQKALDILIKDTKSKNYKTMSLDAAGLDSAAVHIYEKKGFIAVKNMKSDIWNDLVYMKKTL